MNEAAPKGTIIEVPHSHFTREEERGTPQLPVVATPMAMVANAVARGMDPGTIEKLMDLAERHEKNEALKAYNDALASFKAEAVEIIKRKRVHFAGKDGRAPTDYKHAELSDVIEAVGPALSKHGFAWGWKTKQQDGAIEVTCELRHKLGHMETVTLRAPPDDTGGKNKVQQIVSTVTYLERHTLKAACGVSEKGEDTLDRKAAQPEEQFVGMTDLEFADWDKKIRATTTREAAKAVWQESIARAKELGDRDAAEDLKAILFEHGAFIDKAALAEKGAK